jgi:hypothetical protein
MLLGIAWSVTKSRRATRLSAAVLAAVLLGLVAAALPGEGRGPRAAACPASAAPAGYPSACWRPYGAESPFNQLLPANPPILADSDAMVQALLAPGPPQMIAAVPGASDYGRPTFVAEPHSPAYRVHCYLYTCPGLEGHVVRMPVRSAPAAGADHHMTVIDQARRWEYDFYGVVGKSEAPHVIVAKTASRIRLDGPRSSGLHARATAAGFGNLAGLIRAPELAAGRIDHALVISIPCATGFVFPAVKGAAECPPGEISAPVGARLQLAVSDAEIDRPGVARWKRAVLKALARYGAYVVDTGGSEIHVALESDQGYASLGRPPRMLELFARFHARSSGAYRYLALGSGVDWQKLRIVDPCVTEHTC